MRYKGVFTLIAISAAVYFLGGVSAFAGATYGADIESVGTSIFEEALEGEVDQSADTLMQMLSVENIWGRVGDILSESFGSAADIFCLIAGLVLICAVLGRVCEGFESKNMRAGIRFISAAVMSSAIVSTLGGEFDSVERAFESLGALIEGMIPVTATVLAMGGNVGTAGVSSATLYLLMAFVQKVCAVTVIPVCYVMGMTALCSALSGGTLLSGFAGAVKKIYNFGMAALMVALVFVLGAQTTIATAADTAAARGGKLLTQTLIPGIGGAVGETLRTVAGSVQYVKSVVGVGGVVLVAALTLPPIITLLMTRLVFLLTGGMAEMLGCDQEARLLGELGNIYACLLGALSICAVAFCVALGIFVKCAVAVG